MPALEEMIKLLAEASGQNLQIKNLTQRESGFTVIEFKDKFDSASIMPVITEIRSRTCMQAALLRAIDDNPNRLAFPGYEDGPTVTRYIEALKKLVGEKQTEALFPGTNVAVSGILAHGSTNDTYTPAYPAIG